MFIKIMQRVSSTIILVDDYENDNFQRRVPVPRREILTIIPMTVR
jgi:hypothetical protein